MTTSKQSSAFPLRMPDEMKAALTDRARANGRSVNAEVLVLLEQALSAGDISRIPAEQLINELMKRFGPRLQIVLDGSIGTKKKSSGSAR